MVLSRPEAERMAAKIVDDNCREHGEDFVSEGMAPGDGMIERITVALLQVAGGEPVQWREAAARLHRNIADNPHPGIIAMSGIIEDARKLLAALGVLPTTGEE